jgi:hypothetical protein
MNPSQPKTFPDGEYLISVKVCHLLATGCLIAHARTFIVKTATRPHARSSYILGLV